jgi:hypothetical protein
MKMTEPYPQGFCCHEAGHAVVAFSLGVRVVAVSVFFAEEKGWKGDTKTEGTDHLPWKDQITLRIAGKAAEEFFDCSAEPMASFHDLGEIASLLDRMGMSEQPEARVDEGKARARLILEGRREQALKLIAHLAERGHVNEPEFLRLMKGEEARPEHL